jgi:hypothetical protein
MTEMTVTELPRRLHAVEHDPFIDDSRHPAVVVPLRRRSAARQTSDRLRRAAA